MIRLPKESFIHQIGHEPADFLSTAQEREYYDTVVRQCGGNDRYLFQDIVNVGGTGVVLRVLDQELQRPLAMKLLLPPRKQSTETITGFVKEAKIHGWLEHPHIIPLYELGWLQEVGLFFTMSLVQGETLKAFLLRVKHQQTNALQHYSPYWLLSLFRKVCDALAYVHAMGILHLDLKPDNIMIGRYGEVFVLDWGAARIVGNPDTEADPVRREFWRHLLNDIETTTANSVGRLQGTPSFMSPEQATGKQQGLDERSDIFLLGATLYTMFTLKLPYSGTTIRDVLLKARQGNLRPPNLRSPERQIPEEVCRIMMKAMSIDPEERYQSVEALIHDLDEILAGRWLPQEVRTFRTGEMLMNEGDDGDEAYVLLKGNTLVTKQRDDTRVVLGVSQRGDIVGEMALISQEPRSATVQALEDTSVAVLTKDVLEQHLKQLPPYIRNILDALTERLQTTDGMVHPHVTSDCTAIVLKQLRLLIKDRFGAQVQQARIPLDELVEEISHDLGIPAPKVANVILSTHHLQLLRITPDKYLQIPDFEKFAHYTQHVHVVNTPKDDETIA